MRYMRIANALRRGLALYCHYTSDKYCSRARSGITSGNCGFSARLLYMTAVFITDGIWKYEPTLFLSKNIKKGSDLGWTADL